MIPVKSSDGIQTWVGVMQGARLLTMSCSDKLARWNVLGVQGSLLTHFIEPIYLYSVTLGSLFHAHHMFRAMAGRIQQTVEGLPQPYRLNVPRLNLLSSSEVRQPGKAPNYSVNCTVGCIQPEIIDTTKGKEQETSAASRLAKVSLFRRFLKLVASSKLKPLTSALDLTNVIDAERREDAMAKYRQYCDAKTGAINFQLAKN